MAKLEDYGDQLVDIISGIFSRKSEDEKAYPIAIRKQRDILNRVGGDVDRANLIKDTMCIIGFNSISDNKTWKAVYSFYNTLNWDETEARQYLDKFILLRDSINNSKKQQFSMFNKNRKVDNVEILNQTIELVNSELDPEEINLILRACILTGSEISEARIIWEKEKKRELEACNDETSALEEAKYYYDTIIDLARMTINTTLSDVRDVIGRETYEYNSNNLKKIIKQINYLIKRTKKKSEHNEEIDDTSDIEFKPEKLHGLDYNKSQIENLRKAVIKGKEPNKQVYNRSLKSIYKDFSETHDYKGDIFATNEHNKRTRRKAIGVAVVSGIALLKIFSLFSGARSDEKEENQVTESVEEPAESIQSLPNTPEEFRREQITEIPAGDSIARFDQESGDVVVDIEPEK